MKDGAKNEVDGTAAAVTDLRPSDRIITRCEAEGSGNVATSATRESGGGRASSILPARPDESWHGNHHSQPCSARLGWTWRQIDLGWWVIVGLEKCGLASAVRRPGTRA